MEETERAILPFTIQGLFEVNNKTSWMIRPGSVTISFQEPIEVAEVARLSVMELRDLVEERLRSSPPIRRAAGAGSGRWGPRNREC